MARRSKKKVNVKPALKYFIITVFAAFVMYMGYTGTMYYFQHAAMFKITEVVKSPSLQFIQSCHLSGLKGKNIFSVDLVSLQRRLQSAYPSVDRLRVVRQLPNRIVITAAKRDPFAVVAVVGQDLVVDQKGFVLGEMTMAHKGLPYISGLIDASLTANGRHISSSRLKTGLAIIDAVVQNDYLNKFSKQSLDLNNLSKIQLFLGDIEILLDRSKIGEKVGTLGLLLSDAGVPLDEINYLDLRFKEPIINKK